MLKGITIILYEKTQTGTDEFNEPVFQEEPVEVKNVLVGLPKDDEILASSDLKGKKLVYTLGIPKGDTHEWEDRRVELLDPFPVPGIYRTVGPLIGGIEAMIPGPWHKQIKVEKYG